MDTNKLVVGLMHLFWKLAFCFYPSQETCDGVVAIFGGPSAKCGTRWRYLVSVQNFTTTEAKCRVKEQEPSKCACLSCTQSTRATPAPSPSSQAAIVPLYNWWSINRMDNQATAEDRPKSQGYTKSDLIGYIYTTPQAGTVPLYNWWSKSRNDNQATVGDWPRLQGYVRDGSGASGLIGYIYSTPQEGTVPLYNWWSDSRMDNHASVGDCPLSQGYRKGGGANSAASGLIGYIYTTPPTCDDTSAPIDQSKGTCGALWRMLRDTRNYTTAAAKCRVKYEHAVACSCLVCARPSTMATTQAVDTIDGLTLLLKVSDVTHFVKELYVSAVMKMVAADLLNISVAWVAVANVTIESARRLIHHTREEHAISHRSLLSSEYHMDVGYAKVSFQIVIPPEGQSFMSVSIIIQRFDSVSLKDATRAVAKILGSGVFARRYYATVIRKDSVTPSSTPAPRQESKEYNVNTMATHTIVLISVSITLFLICCIVLFDWRLRNARLRRKQNSENNGLVVTSLATGSPQAILYPPDAISGHDGALLREAARAMVDYTNHNASVCLTYAIGHRPQDAVGTGPGLFYATAFTKLLYDNGIGCFSELVLPSDSDRSHVSAHISHSKPSCNVLLVLQTRALYECLDCLQEIYLAQSSHMRILPIRVERDLPIRKDEQWPQIANDDMDRAIMLTAVQHTFGQLNSIPSPPYTVLDQPGVLEDVIVDLKRFLHRAPHHENTPCAITQGASIADNSVLCVPEQTEHHVSSLPVSHSVALDVISEPSDDPGCKQRLASAPTQPREVTQKRHTKQQRPKERATTKAAVGRAATKTSRQLRQQQRQIENMASATNTPTTTAALATPHASTTNGKEHASLRGRHRGHKNTVHHSV